MKTEFKERQVPGVPGTTLGEDLLNRMNNLVPSGEDFDGSTPILAADDTGAVNAYAVDLSFGKKRSMGSNDSTAANKLIDSGATFVTDGVEMGDTVLNLTDRTSAKVTNVDSETQLALDTDIFTDTGKDYAVGPGVFQAPLSYVSYLAVGFKAANTNTGASTLNVNGLGAKAVKKLGGSDLSAGDIQAGQIVVVQYDGANFQMVGALGQDFLKLTGGTLTGDLSIENSEPVLKFVDTDESDPDNRTWIGVVRNGNFQLQALNGGGAGGNVVEFVRNGTSITAIKINGYTVWHAGNDGAGSGLDADKLKGVDHRGQGGTSEHPAATTSVAGFLSTTDKTKVDKIQTGNYLGDYSPGTKVIVYSDAEKTTTNDTWTLLKEIEVTRWGTINSYYEYKQGGTQELVDIQLWKNGVAIGQLNSTSNQTYQPWDEDVSVQPGDKLQIYGKGLSDSQPYVRNFRLRNANYLVEKVLLN